MINFFFAFVCSTIMPLFILPLNAFFFVLYPNDSSIKSDHVTRYNGGPGAASMFGLFVELGPYYLNGATHTCIYNPERCDTDIHVCICIYILY